MSALNILLIGETWISYGTHLKGSTAYATGEYEEGHQPLTEALAARGHHVTVIPNHLATNTAPWTAEDFAAYDVVVLSDVPADTLLLHADPFKRGIAVPNRLGELARWVREGKGGLVMVGGYMSFSGFEGKGNYHFTPLASVLPAGMYGFDDRVERPEGIVPSVTDATHPVLAGIEGEWPMFLGYNKLKPVDGASQLVEFEGDPFLAVQQFGTGRSVAFASDCSPHWGSPEFTAWEHYPTLWENMMLWAAGRL